MTSLPRSRSRPAVRRVVVVPVTGALVLAGTLLAAPAGADVPEGFSPDPENLGLFPALLLLGGLPLLLFVLIAVAVYLPAMTRGERVAPGVAPMNDQWLGGPRQGTRQLAGPDGDQSQAGGARGRW